LTIRDIERYIAAVKGRVGLGDWVITASRPGPGERDNRAFVVCDAVQLRADTFWHLASPDWRKASDDERKQLILHELVHVLVSRQSQVIIDVIRAHVADKALQEEALARLDDQEETLVGKLSAIFHQLLKGSELANGG
jgi:hypothetical protein